MKKTKAKRARRESSEPIPMLLYCPMCAERHIDRGEFKTKPHHTHACQECGHVWRPAIVPTVGVLYLPGFKDPDFLSVEAPAAPLSRRHGGGKHG